jgi:pimeloyl-ACP methyl ester carboxylesterase
MHTTDLDTRTTRWAGIAGRARGDFSAPRRPLVFLHGLTFDHRMWHPVLDALPAGLPAIAFDLPGHGNTPALESHRLDEVVDAIHDAVVDAGLRSPVIVGHSISAGIAAIYAGRYPAAATVSVDSQVRVEPFAQLLHSLAPQLRGDGFPRAWAMFRTSMHVDRVPEDGRALLAAGDDVAQALVLSYWSDLLDRSVEETMEWLERHLAESRHANRPCLMLFGNALDPRERGWIEDRLPQAEIVVWPVGHHFPHLADPGRFAALLTGLLAGLPVAR